MVCVSIIASCCSSHKLEIHCFFTVFHLSQFYPIYRVADVCWQSSKLFEHQTNFKDDISVEKISAVDLERRWRLCCSLSSQSICNVMPRQSSLPNKQSPWPPPVLTSLLALLLFFSCGLLRGWFHPHDVGSSLLSHAMGFRVSDLGHAMTLWADFLSTLPHTLTLCSLSHSARTCKENKTKAVQSLLTQCTSRHVCGSKYMLPHISWCAHTHTHTNTPPVNYSAGRILCQLLLGGRGKQRDISWQKEKKCSDKELNM